MRDMMMYRGKLVPRVAKSGPQDLEQLKADYVAKQRHAAEVRKVETEARKGVYRSGLRDVKSLARHFL